MRELPVGVPKFLVTTKVNDPGSPQYYVGEKDVTLMPSFADIAGLNKVTNQILANAAYAISGMVNAPRIEKSGKPIAVLGMIGLTTGLGLGVKESLEEKGYEVIVFIPWESVENALSLLYGMIRMSPASWKGVFGKWGIIYLMACPTQAPTD